MKYYILWNLIARSPDSVKVIEFMTGDIGQGHSREHVDYNFYVADDRSSQKLERRNYFMEVGLYFCGPYEILGCVVNL